MFLSLSPLWLAFDKRFLMDAPLNGRKTDSTTQFYLFLLLIILIRWSWMFISAFFNRTSLSHTCPSVFWSNMRKLNNVWRTQKELNLLSIIFFRNILTMSWEKYSITCLKMLSVKKNWNDVINLLGSVRLSAKEKWNSIWQWFFIVIFEMKYISSWGKKQKLRVTQFVCLKKKRSHQKVELFPK
jgi:hypothetical protein